MLRKKQYEHNKPNLGKRIILNKIINQRRLLYKLRNKDAGLKESLAKIDEYIDHFNIIDASDLFSLLSLEGAVAKLYFKQLFRNYEWRGRKPRVKQDYINTILDIGYTLLFNYIEALLHLYDFDVYVGVLHTLFYKRKSLVCDIIEPFRYIIDEAIIKSLNLKQFKREDFGYNKGLYYLKRENNAKYIEVFIKAISENKHVMFKYVQNYYRAFLKGCDVEKFPFL